MNSNRINIELHVDDKGSVTVKSFGDKTEKSMGKAGQSVGKFSQKSGSALKSLKSNWMAVTAATAGAIAMIKKSIEAFMEQESAELKLAVAMMNAGTYTQANFRAMKDYASALQQVTKYGDEVTLATMANLETYGMHTEELKAATKASLDLAAAKGIDLKAASELIGKAFVGETSSLSRYGIILDEGIPKTEKFAAVLELVSRRFGGTATAELETYGGQWQKIKNWWGDIVEKVGLGMLKTLEAVQLAVGMVGAGFYTMLEGIASGVLIFVQQLEKIPIIGEKFSGIVDHLKTIKGGFTSAKESALGFADTNLTMLTGFDRVEKFAEKAYLGIETAAEDAGDTQIKVSGKVQKAEEKAAKEREKTAQKFSDKYQNLSLGDYEYAIKKIKEQGTAYTEAGADRMQVQEWVSSEIQKEDDKVVEAALKGCKDLTDTWQRDLTYRAEAHATSLAGQTARADDYARESKEIYHQLRDDVNEASLSEYDYKLDLLDKQYKDYKEHLSDLGDKNAEYVDGVALLDTWLANRKQDLLDEQATKTDDYARESTAIYKQLRDDVNGYALSEYDYKLDLLHQQYTNYKAHLTALGGDNQEYADGVQLLDTWMAQQKNDLRHDEIQKHGEALDVMKLAFEDYADHHQTKSELMYEGWTSILTDMESGFTTILVDVIKGKWSKMADDWDALWEGMLDIVVGTVAKMAVEAASVAVIDWISDAIWASKGVWDLEGSADGIPVVAHPGEMIIPASVADQVRDNMGEGGFSQDFSGLAEALGASGKDAFGALAKGTAKSYSAVGATGIAAMLSDRISFEQFAAGLASPEAFVGSVFRGGIPAFGREILGVADLPGIKGLPGSYGWDDIGAILGSVGLSFLGIPGLIAAAIGKPVGAFLGDYLGDALDARQYESMLDAYEDTYGSRRDAHEAAMAAIAEGIYSSGPSAQSMYGYSPMQMAIGSYYGVSPGDVSAGLGPAGASMYGPDFGGFGAETGAGAEEGGFSGDTEGGADSGYGRMYGGLTVGPESGYDVRMHGTEVVLSQKRPIPARMEGGPGDGGSDGGIHFHLHGAKLIDRRALDEFADEIYPRLKKLEAWGH